MEAKVLDNGKVELVTTKTTVIEGKVFLNDLKMQIKALEESKKQVDEELEKRYALYNQLKDDERLVDHEEKAEEEIVEKELVESTEEKAKEK